MSLLVGMFLKSGEAMVTGIANRVFAAFQALIPATMGAYQLSRVAVLRLGGFPQGATIDEIGNRLKDLVHALKELPGVLDAESEADARVVRVKYDAGKTAMRAIRQEVEFKGLMAAQENGGPRVED